MDEDLYSLIQNADPATLQSMIDAGLVPGKQAALQHGLDQPMAQGREVGRTYVASSPLEHLANAMRSAVAYKRMNDIVSGQGQGRLAYLRMLAQKPTASPGGPVPDAPHPLNAGDTTGMYGPGY